MSSLPDLIRRFVGRFTPTNRNSPGPRVLLYHRVYSPARDPQLLSVSEENFSAQMSAIVANCDVYPVNELLTLDPASREYSRAVAITFDDGYFDNLELAEPILRRHGLPATVFVSSGFIDSRREMWWDDLERLLLGHFYGENDRLVLDVNGVERSWKITGGAGSNAWNVRHPPETGAQRAYLEIAAILKWLAPAQRSEMLERIRVQLSADESVRPSHRGMTREELSAMDSNGIMEVGGHTCDHVALSAMPPEVQQEQIQRDKTALEAQLGHEIAGFAYPYGSETECDRVTMNIAAEAGYEFACVNIPAPFAARENNFAIPRHLVRNWSASEFLRNYRVWQGLEA